MSSASSSPCWPTIRGTRRLEVVVVGLGPAKRGRERAERGRLDDRRVLLRGQAGAAQQVDEPVVLGVGRDGLQLGGEAVDAAVELVLGLDRLVGGQARRRCAGGRRRARSGR